MHILKDKTVNLAYRANLLYSTSRNLHSDILAGNQESAGAAFKQ